MSISENKVVVVALVVSEPELVSGEVYRVILTNPSLHGELELVGSKATLATMLAVISHKDPSNSDNSIEKVISSLFELAALTKAIKQGG